jgi:hypothetical protein
MENSAGRDKLLILGLASMLLNLAVATPARAVQFHGGSEGLVAHQLGHLLFIVGMAYLLSHLGRLGLAGPGWKSFRGFLWTIIAWNLLTFSGHWLDNRISPDQFLTSGGRISAFDINNFTDAYFFLTRLDHLLLVPAFVLLMLALQSWSHGE